jgi:hypothetical protein
VSFVFCFCERDNVFVYGNGKWHKVRNVEEAAKTNLFSTCCGLRYNDSFNVSEDESIRGSNHFCSRCSVELSIDDAEKASKLSRS